MRKALHSLQILNTGWRCDESRAVGAINLVKKSTGLLGTPVRQFTFSALPIISRTSIANPNQVSSQEVIHNYDTSI